MKIVQDRNRQIMSNLLKHEERQRKEIVQQIRTTLYEKNVRSVQ